MADRRISKKIQREIQEALQSKSQSRELLDQTLADTVQSFQDSASAKAATEFAKNEYSRIVKSRAATASALARTAVESGSSYAQRVFAMQQLSSGVATFAGPRTLEKIATAQTSFDQAQFLGKQIFAGNIPQEIRKSSSERIISEFASFVPPTRLVQAQEAYRRINEQEYRGRARQAALITDPRRREEAFDTLRRESEGIIDPGSRLATDLVRQQRRARQEFVTSADTTMASALRERVKSARSPAEAIGVLDMMKGVDPGTRTLKEIERLTKEQNALIKRDTDKFEEAQKQFPALTALLTGGGGNGMFGGGPVGPGGAPGMNPQQFNRIAGIGRFISGVGQGAGAAAAAYGSYLDSVARAEERTFGSGAAAQSIRARLNEQMLTQYSGEGLLRQFGDILVGNRPDQSQYLGVGGIARARQQAGISMQEQRGSEMRSAILGGAGLAAGVGALALAPFTGGLSLAALGLAGIGAGISGLTSNRAVQETGIFGAVAQRKAAQERALDFEQTAARLTDQDIQRNYLYSSAFDRALALREAEMQGLSMSGGSVSFRQQVVDRFGRANPLAGQTFSDPQMQIARASLRQNTLIDRAIDIGMDPAALTLAAARAEMYSDSRSRLNPTATAMRLRELEIGGRGSVAQNLANIAQLNRLSGGSDSKKELEDVLSLAFQRGFKGARLSQEFAQAVFEGMSRTQSADMKGIEARTSQISELFGGGERGLMFSRESMSQLDRFGQNKLIDVQANYRTVQAMSGLDPRFGALSADILGEMPASERIQALTDVQKVFRGQLDKTRLSPKARELYSNLLLGKGDAGTVGNLIDAQIGGPIAQMRNNLTSIVKERGGKISARDVPEILAEAGIGNVSELAGYSTGAIAQLLTASGSMPEEITKALTRYAQTSGESTEAKVQQYIRLNEPRARAERGKMASGAFGENVFTRKIREDLLNSMGRAPGMNLRQAAGLAGIDLSKLGDLGTGLSEKQLAKYLDSPELSRQILSSASDFSIGADGKISKEDENIKKIRSALDVSRTEIMASTLSQEAAALGLNSISLTQLTTPSIEGIGEAVARAMKNAGGVRTSSPPGNTPPPSAQSVMDALSKLSGQ